MTTLTKDDFPEAFRSNCENIEAADELVTLALAEHLATVLQRDILQAGRIAPLHTLAPHEQERLKIAAKIAVHFLRPGWERRAYHAAEESQLMLDELNRKGVSRDAAGRSRSIITSFLLTLRGDTLTDDERVTLLREDR